MILVIEYYTPSSEKRNEEYLKCIRENIKSKLFDNIHIFVEHGHELPEDITDEEIVFDHKEERKTFQDLFKFCNSFTEDTICVISNTDIIFDNSINYVNKDNIEGKFLCLTRWDILPDNNIRFFDNQAGIAHFSQDSWIFKTPVPIKNADFYMGKPGCDNKLAYLAMESKLDVRNPSKGIITKHLHLSQYRTYVPGGKETVVGPWVGVEPTNNINRESKKRLLQ